MTLHQKKHRDARQEILVEGEHLRQEAQRAGLVLKTIGLDESNDVVINHMIADKLSQTNSGSTMFTLLRKPQYTLDYSGPRYLLCDGVQDPGNLGTMIRTAFSFGFDAIILSTDCADEYNDKVIRATQGAVFQIPIIRTDLLAVIQKLQEVGVSVYATNLDDTSKTFDDLNNSKVAIVMGSEGQGVSKAVIQSADASLKIETSHFESLNVAVATGIICYHFRKSNI